MRVDAPTWSALSARVLRTAIRFTVSAIKPDRQRLLDACAQYVNVITGGRQGLFRYVFLDAAMEMGQIAAQQIMGKGSRRFGCARPGASRERFARDCRADRIALRCQVLR